MECPVRKHPRLKSYDYGQNGCYFVTICTQGRKRLLGRIDVCRAGCPQPAAQALPQMRLTHIGALVTYYIERIPQAYPGVDLAHYVVMPNHIHLLFTIQEMEDGGVRAPRPTLPTVVRSLKTMVTRQLGYSIFQASFYDHVVRSEPEFAEIWKYIEENPIKWAEDRYYADAL